MGAKQPVPPPQPVAIESAMTVDGVEVRIGDVVWHLQWMVGPKQMRITEILQRANGVVLIRGQRESGTHRQLMADEVYSTRDAVPFPKARTPQEAYNEGYNQALRDFAWWKDGEQYVGNCGTKLADVLRS